jgi:dipeptidyl aminopeptidase/acylaminoacyl peptidase
MRFLLMIKFLLLMLFSVTTQAKLSPADFFSNPAMTSAHLSPDGKKVASLSFIGENQKLELLDIHSGQKSTLLDVTKFSPQDASLRGISWIDNQYIAAQFFQNKKGVGDLLDTKASYHLLVIKLPTTPSMEAEVFSIRTKGWLVDPLISEEGYFLYAKAGIYSKIYRINAAKLNKHKQKLNKLVKKDGGQFKKKNEVISVDGYVARWFINHDGSPKAALHYLKADKIGLTVFDDKFEKKRLKEWDFSSDESENQTSSKRIVPVALANEENTFYCLDIAEENERSVYKVNYSTGEQELVFEAESYKIIDLILTRNNLLVGAKVIHNGGVRHIYVDEKSHQGGDSKIKSGLLKQTIDISADNNTALYYTEKHNQPGQYLLKNNKTGKEKNIGSAFPTLVNQLNSKLIEKNLIVNGLEIPYLLTLPKTTSKSQLPLIVMPHGGPIGVFDNRYFDPTTQFLAANGYAVLRVNFRGSSGHTSELLQAGKKQWGDLMLEDIYQVTKSVITRSDINANKVCVMGMSYGGYAASMLTILHPQLYRCAVNIAGVSDLNLYLNAPDRTEKQKAWLKEQVGDSLADYEALKSISPVYLAEKLQHPILIMHGAKDNVVDVEHAYRLKLMLDKYNKSYAWHIFPEGTHNFGDTQTSTILFNKLIQFIEVNI